MAAPATWEDKGIWVTPRGAVIDTYLSISVLSANHAQIRKLAVGLAPSHPSYLLWYGDCSKMTWNWWGYRLFLIDIMRSRTSQMLLTQNMKISKWRDLVPQTLPGGTAFECYFPEEVSFGCCFSWRGTWVSLRYAIWTRRATSQLSCK